MADEERKPHGEFGYVTCVPSERLDGDEFWDHVRTGLVGLVPLRIQELEKARTRDLRWLGWGGARIVASLTGELQFPRDKRRSEVLFELISGFAAGARLVDEGVTWLGVHACLYPHEGCPKNRDR